MATYIYNIVDRGIKDAPITADEHYGMGQMQLKLIAFILLTKLSKCGRIM
jgi:hypothetical protein